MTKRVVVVGMGIISPLGGTIKTAFDRLKVLENCVVYEQELDRFENLHTRLAAKVKDFVIPESFDRKIRRTMGNVALMATVTAREALIDAGLLNDEIITNGQTGVSYGSSSGAMDALMDFYSMCIDNKVKSLNSGSYIKMMPQTTAVNLSLYFKTHGRLITTSTACTSGSMGIGAAYEAIKNGYQTVMIAGGAEEFHPVQVGVFDTLYATSTKNDRQNLTPSPFDKERDGLVVGEGAGTLILEEYEHAKNRGAKMYAEIVGYATNTDGTHITNPNSEMMAEVMKTSLKSANLAPSNIGYINAHGTGTVNGDIAESNAVYNALNGKKIPISSIKSYTGHTLGACGSIESILTIEMMNNNWYAPTLNLKNIDENCAELDYLISPKTFESEFVMNNNFAFGGINTSLIFKRI